MPRWGNRANKKFALAPEGQAYCSKCDSYKPHADFSANKLKHEGRCIHCKACVHKNYQKHRADRVLKDKTKNYGISAKDYVELLEKQGHVCAICGEPETRIHRGSLASFSVDHDHETGKVRGLLCGTCNHGLGYFRDDVELMKNAIEYLNYNGSKPKRKKHDAQMVSKATSQHENLNRIAKGMPKILVGSESDIENLPLFATN